MEKDRGLKRPPKPTPATTKEESISRFRKEKEKKEKEVKKICQRCGQRFDPSSNSPSPCLFHSGPSFSSYMIL